MPRRAAPRKIQQSTRSGRNGLTGASLSRPTRRVQLIQVHQVVDAGEQEPLAAAQAADERVVQRAGLRLVAGDVRAARSTIRWLWAILRRSAARSASAGPAMPGTTVGASAGQRPAAASAAARHRPTRASQSWPMACATFQSSSPPGARRASSGSASTIPMSASASVASWRGDRPRPSRRRPAAGPPAGRR